MRRPGLIAALTLLPAICLAADNPAGAKSRRVAGIFSKADTDGDGKRSRAEVAKAMPQLAARFDSSDSNKDGQLSRGELNAWKKAQRSEWQACSGERFRHADSNGDGAISRVEAEQHAPRLAKKFDLIDRDKDGRLTQDELRAYRETRRSRKDNG
jgi:Ca2+-binding EF-hand superfamily protein